MSCARNHFAVDRDCYACGAEDCSYRKDEQFFSRHCEACRSPLTVYTCFEVDGMPDSFFYQELRRPMTAAAGGRLPVVTGRAAL